MSVILWSSSSEQQTTAFAAELSLWARPGMVVLLEGELGAGKSAFARGFLRALADDNSLDVPSPTFTLVQSYNETRIPAFHADLYRLSSARDVAELGLGDLLHDHIGLIEWPDRLDAPLTPDTLTVSLVGEGEKRTLSLTATGRWQTALDRNAAIRQFLKDSSGTRRFLEGDASSRRYEWLDGGNNSKPILMDMAQRPDGPPVKFGKPYSQIAHLAEGLAAVVAVNTHLVGFGYSAPRLLKHDTARGLALIENLGGQVYGKMLHDGVDMMEPMCEAARALADMARRDWPAAIDLENNIVHHVRAYDGEAQLIEVDLLPSWFWSSMKGADAPQSVHDEFEQIWRGILPLAMQTPPQWVLRDYHSPNLIWIPERPGIARVGMIDTQDAVMGHGAYDLMSLTQDARVDYPAQVNDAAVQAYLAERRNDKTFDESAFMTAYAVLGAQRATKILGIFARLSKRDGKHGYLKHMPRVSRALTENLQHPALSELKQWYLDHLPQALAA